MKILNKLTVAIAALLIIVNSFPVPTLKAYADTDEETVSDTYLPFTASIERTSTGYAVMGTLTNFPADANLVRTMYSTDGKTFYSCIKDWDFHLLNTDDAGMPSKLQKHVCLYANFEPFKSYLAGSLDRFYIKLHISRETGDVYETMPVVIDRGVPQPVPENLTAGASFIPAMAVIKTRPFSYYGRYCLTVSADASAEDIAALLPDTIPVKIDFYDGKNAVADGITDCPVTWKNLSFPALTAGESITIEDAAEEITVCAGTRVTTPIGIFTLNEPLNIDPLLISDYAPPDEIRLVLNVVSKGENPTGVLSADREGLTMSFNMKPTGATSIRAYTLSEGDSKWTEIPNTTLMESVNSQPSIENSGYALILDNDTEPYRSYLESKEAGDNPTPFCVGLKIEGGVYDGRQLTLAWPDTYDLPYDLPDITGQGGNEANAGVGNTGDATEEGQRPNLPPNPEDKTEIPPKTDSGSNDEQQSGLTDNPDDKPDIPDTTPTTNPGNNVGQQSGFTDNDTPAGNPDSPDTPPQTDTGNDGQQPGLIGKPNDNPDTVDTLSKTDTGSDRRQPGLNDHGNSTQRSESSPLKAKSINTMETIPDYHSDYNPDNNTNTYLGETAVYSGQQPAEQTKDTANIKDTEYGISAVSRADTNTGSRIPYFPVIAITASVCIAGIYITVTSQRKNK